jgi:hypothetical protein
VFLISMINVFILDWICHPRAPRILFTHVRSRRMADARK